MDSEKHHLRVEFEANDEADDEFEYIYEDNRPDIYQESKVGSDLDHHQQKESHIENNDEDNEPDNYNNNYDDDNSSNKIKKQKTKN